MKLDKRLERFARRRDGFNDYSSSPPNEEIINEGREDEVGEKKMLGQATEQCLVAVVVDGAWLLFGIGGAYLVEGIGHCGACHTPRDVFGAEKRNEALSGGEAEGWRAFPINASSPAPIPWDADLLYTYLRQGWHGLHGVAGGAMAPVADNLASVPDADVRAIAVYVASLMGEPAQVRREQGERLAGLAKPFGVGGKPQSAGSQAAPPQAAGDVGAAIYAGARHAMRAAVPCPMAASTSRSRQ